MPPAGIAFVLGGIVSLPYEITQPVVVLFLKNQPKSPLHRGKILYNESVKHLKVE